MMTNLLINPLDYLHLYEKTPLYTAYDSGNFEIYYLVDEMNLFHHESLPSLIINFPLKDEVFQLYYSHGLLYREDEAAVIFSSKGLNFLYNFHQNKILNHGSSLLGEGILPKLIKFLKEGDIFLFDYILDNSLLSILSNSHSFSFTGPSLIKIKEYNSPFEKRMHFYLKEGKLHREDGPALIHLSASQKVYDSGWYLEGIYLPISEKKDSTL